MVKLTVPPASPSQKKKYPTDSCISCYKNPGVAHYAGSLVWHVPSEHFDENYISYTVVLGGRVPECDCTHGEHMKAATPQKPAACKHVRYARFKEAQRVTPEGELFQEEEGEEETEAPAKPQATLETLFG